MQSVLSTVPCKQGESKFFALATTDGRCSKWVASTRSLTFSQLALSHATTTIVARSKVLVKKFSIYAQVVGLGVAFILGL